MKFQYAVVGIGDALPIKHLVAETPDLVFRRLVGADLHFTDHTNALIPESPALIEIDASLIVRQKLFDLVGRSVRCEVNFVAVYLAGGKHCSYNGITLFVDGRNERRLLLGDKLKQL